MTTPTDNPRVVTPGIETQPDQIQPPPPGVYVGLDWIRCTGPECLRDQLNELMCELCSGEGKELGKAKWFKHGLVWEPGVMLSWGHRSDICQVDFQGSRLKLLNGESRVDLLRQMIELGMKATRIDGALDLIGQQLGICVQAERSCDQGELCILRRYSPNNEFGSGGKTLRRLLKLGSRDSPVCARIYDKGLEQKVSGEGYWERLEIEWKKDRASQVAASLCEAGTDTSELLAGLILGSIDFRAHNGRSEIKRRPRSTWWHDLIGSTEIVQTSSSSDEHSFHRWHSWFRSSVAPRLLQFSQTTRDDPREVLAWLCEGCLPKSETDLVLEGFASQFRKAVSRSRTLRDSCQ